MIVDDEDLERIERLADGDDIAEGLLDGLRNVWILPLHGPQPQDGFPTKIVWRSASGAVVKTVAGV